MSVFADLHETRQLGAPIVALFRTAFARDPSPAELARLVPQVRDRVPLATIAREIVTAPEYVARYGGLSRPALIEHLCGSAGTPPLDGWDGPEAELLATIGQTGLTRGTIPLLPGLVPGAPPDDDVAYRLWVDEYDAPRNSPATGSDALVSLLMIAGDTEMEAAGRTVAALTGQSHAGWELCLAARTLSPWSARTLQALAAAEPRVRLIPEYELRAAFEASTGALVGLLAPGDQLAPDALARVVAAFDPAIELVFTDEDVADASGRHSPRFKPGFSPDQPAIGRLAILRRGPPDEVLAGHAAARLTPAQVRHLPAVLLHRAAAASETDRSGGAPFAVPAPPPPVTVIVLTKDHADLLATCTSGLLDGTDYPALQVILVDNGSTDPAAAALLAELEGRDRVRVLRRPGPFNFAALNNDAARGVTDGLLVLLNSDVEVIERHWLSELVAQLARPGVGIVGARLLYPDRTIQHAGILLGPDGAATHVGRGAAETATGYLGQLASVRDFSAVTGACLGIAAETWQRVGGMDERLAVTWNDVDLCLRVRRAGLRVVWTPRATLIHREAMTRGLEAADPAKLARFRAEQRLVMQEWGDALEHDPFLNPNLLALDSGALVLTRPRSPLPRDTELGTSTF